MKLDDIQFETFKIEGSARTYEQASLMYTCPSLSNSAHPCYGEQIVITRYSDNDNETYYIQSLMAADANLTSFIPKTIIPILDKLYVPHLPTDNDGIIGPCSLKVTNALLDLLEKAFDLQIAGSDLENESKNISDQIKQKQFKSDLSLHPVFEELSTLEIDHHITIPIEADDADCAYLSKAQRTLPIRFIRVEDDSKGQPAYCIQIPALGKDSVLSCDSLKKQFQYPKELARHHECSESFLGPYPLSQVQSLSPYLISLSGILFTASMLCSTAENLRQAMDAENPPIPKEKPGPRPQLRLVPK